MRSPKRSVSILPATPVVFAEAIFDRYNWVVIDNPLIPVSEIIARFPVAIGLEFVMVVFGEFGCGDIHSDSDVGAELVAGFFDGELNKFEWLVVAVFYEWSIATFVANGCCVAAFF